VLGPAVQSAFDRIAGVRRATRTGCSRERNPAFSRTRRSRRIVRAAQAPGRCRAAEILDAGIAAALDELARGR
jgi:hypothetical protein